MKGENKIMKKGSVAFLAGLLALSVGGVATASALIITGANAPQQQGSIDSVLYLEWGATQELSQISNLTPDAPAYRTISVAAPEKSASAPNGKFTATLAANPDGLEDAVNHTASIAGLTVTIYDKAFDIDGNPGAGAVKFADLSSLNLSAYEEVSAAKVYYLKITIDSENYAAYTAPDAATELCGKITFSYGVNE